jgi:hypothetical protein
MDNELERTLRGNGFGLAEILSGETEEDHEKLGKGNRCAF